MAGEGRLDPQGMGLRREVLRTVIAPGRGPRSERVVSREKTGSTL